MVGAAAVVLVIRLISKYIQCYLCLIMLLFKMNISDFYHIIALVINFQRIGRPRSVAWGSWGELRNHD